jgi:hypothetical protein
MFLFFALFGNVLVGILIVFGEAIARVSFLAENRLDDFVGISPTYSFGKMTLLFMQRKRVSGTPLAKPGHRSSLNLIKELLHE